VPAAGCLGSHGRHRTADRLRVGQRQAAEEQADQPVQAVAPSNDRVDVLRNGRANSVVAAHAHVNENGPTRPQRRSDRQGDADPRPERVADQHGAADRVRIERPGHVVGKDRHGIGIRRQAGRAAVPGQIERQDGRRRAPTLHQGSPDVGGVAQAMQQHDRR